MFLFREEYSYLTTCNLSDRKVRNSYCYDLSDIFIISIYDIHNYYSELVMYKLFIILHVNN